MDKGQLKYTKEHLWVFQKEGSIVIGLSDYARQQLGTAVFLNLPEAGEQFAAGEVFGDVESVKAVSDLIFPVDGEVIRVNEALLDSLEQLDGDIEESWLVEAKTENGNGLGGLMDAGAYRQYLEQL